MQLHGLIIIVAAASVFENEKNTGHTAKCDWINVTFLNVFFLLGSLKRNIIIIK